MPQVPALEDRKPELHKAMCKDKGTEARGLLRVNKQTLNSNLSGHDDAVMKTTEPHAKSLYNHTSFAVKTKILLKLYGSFSKA